jgi:putative sigma-54 modulation protein
MNLEITGKKVEITPAIRSYVEDNLKKITKFFPKIDEVTLILTVQKYRNLAELSIYTKNGTYTSVEETTDMYAAINTAFDKIKKQARRKRKKIISLHRKEKVEKLGLLSSEQEESIPSTLSIIPYKGFSLKPLHLDEASVKLNMSDDIFIVFRNAANDKINVIYKRKDGNHGLIEPQK